MPGRLVVLVAVYVLTVCSSVCAQTCTSSFAEYGGTCSGTTATITGDVTVGLDKIFEVSSDTVVITGNLTLVETTDALAQSGKLRFTFYLSQDNATSVAKTGTVTVGGRVNFPANATIILRFEDGPAGKYVSKPLAFAAPSVTANKFQPEFSNKIKACRGLNETTFGASWTGLQLTLNLDVYDKGERCDFAKGSRLWVMIVWGIELGIALLIVIFAIVTCCNSNLNEKVWGPPDD